MGAKIVARRKARSLYAVQHTGAGGLELTLHTDPRDAAAGLRNQCAYGCRVVEFREVLKRRAKKRPVKTKSKGESK